MESLSIIIPVHNRAEMLARCLKSVAAQTYRPLQIVVVDNNSTDASKQVAIDWGERTSASDFEVKVLSEPHPGASTARACGARAATGKILAFVDSDDTLRPEYASSIMHAFKSNPKSEIIYWRKIIHCSGNKAKELRCPHRLSLESHIAHAVLNTMGCAVTKALYRRCGGWNKNIHQWDDWELGVRYLTALQGNIVRIDSILVDIFSHSDSITGESWLAGAGGWEMALKAVAAHAETLPPSEKKRLLRLVAFKQSILAAHYYRENDTALASTTIQKAMDILPSRYSRIILRLVYAYTGHGWRGAASWALPLLQKK